MAHDVQPIFLRPSDVQRLLGIGKTKLWELSQTTDFPRKIQISPGCVGYRRDEIEEWAARRPPAEPRRSMPASLAARRRS